MGMKTHSSVRWAFFLAVLLFGACQATTGNVYREKGLVTGKPAMNTYPEKDPGETTPLSRSYEIAPPLVPHRVGGFTIDRTTNECLDCHLEGEETGDGHSRATKVPPSHFTNEHTGEVKTDQVVGIRYNCTQCHVPQSGEKPPIPQM
jgi:cytochrome c-type protein NapB